MTEPPPRPHDPAEAHKRRVFLIGIAVTLVILGLLVWLAQWFVEQQRIERCLASRRPDCFRIDSPPRPGGPAELQRQ